MGSSGGGGMRRSIASWVLDSTSDTFANDKVIIAANDWNGHSYNGDVGQREFNQVFCKVSGRIASQPDHSAISTSGVGPTAVKRPSAVFICSVLAAWVIFVVFTLWTVRLVLRGPQFVGVHISEFQTNSSFKVVQTDTAFYTITTPLTIGSGDETTRVVVDRNGIIKGIRPGWLD